MKLPKRLVYRWGDIMKDIKKLKRAELDIYDLIKRYEKVGTKEELLEELKSLDKNIMKDMRNGSNWHHGSMQTE